MFADGFEPPLPAYKAGVGPLNYTNDYCRSTTALLTLVGFEPTLRV